MAAIALDAFDAQAAVRRRAPAALPPPVLGRRTAFPWTALRPARAGPGAGHVHCVAPSGTGMASSVFAPMIARDLAAGVGVTVIGGQGGELAPLVAAQGRARGLPVTVWSPGTAEGGAWNPLSAWASAVEGAEALGCALGALLPPGGGAAPGADLLRQAWGDDLAAVQVALAALAADGGRDSSADAARGALAARLSEALTALLRPPLIRRALCPQPGVPVIDMAQILRAKGAAIVDLPVRPDRPMAALLGGLWLAAAAAAAAARGPGTPHRIYVEDFPRMAGGQDAAAWLERCAAGSVGLVMGSRSPEHVRSAGPAVAAALRAAVPTQVFLRCGPEQARELAEDWCGEPRLRAAALSELPFGFAIAQTAARRDRRRLATLRLANVRRPAAL